MYFMKKAQEVTVIKLSLAWDERIIFLFTSRKKKERESEKKERSKEGKKERASTRLGAEAS